ncbi:hypothetical protein ABZ752_22840 [Streptomyces roseifaciens]
MPPTRRRRQLDPEAAAARDAAEAELKKLRKDLDDLEGKVKTARDVLADAIAKHMTAEVLSPTEAADASGYDRVYASKVARERGAPKTRNVEPPKRAKDSAG